LDIPFPFFSQPCEAFTAVRGYSVKTRGTLDGGNQSLMEVIKDEGVGETDTAFDYGRNNERHMKTVSDGHNGQMIRLNSKLSSVWNKKYTYAGGEEVYVRMRTL
jgi:hypothetical protein